MTIERVNELFQSGSITLEEHSFLIRKLSPPERQISNYAWASLLCAAAAWTLMLKFTKNGQEFAFLSREGKITTTMILAPLSLVFYYLARKEARENEEVGGLEIAARGQALSIALLLIVVLFLLMYLSS
jgi:hypothetical protein